MIRGTYTPDIYMYIYIYTQRRPWPGKLRWRLVAILTCKSFVILGYRGERLIEPSSSWFPKELTRRTYICIYIYIHKEKKKRRWRLVAQSCGYTVDMLWICCGYAVDMLRICSGYAVDMLHTWV